MATWGEFARAAPELAAVGESRFRDAEVAYIATVRPDGSPRVHPVTPIVGEGRLFLFMEPTSPKGQDLRRNPAYAMHSLVTDQNGTPGEFWITGQAVQAADSSTRAVAVGAAAYDPAERYILFELSVQQAASTVYEGNQPVRRRWHRGEI
jgi:pyridoxamine 5'-phosphate oxidase-like protein